MEPHLQPTVRAALPQRPAPEVRNTPAPLDVLGDRHMPATTHFRREHFQAPRIDPADWRIGISGLLATPGIVTLADLAAMPQRSPVVVLECPGHRRAALVPPTFGPQWEVGAV